LQEAVHVAGRQPQGIEISGLFGEALSLPKVVWAYFDEVAGLCFTRDFIPFL
jgi:hypothetical protein